MPETLIRNERIMLAFAVKYYAINRQYARLVQLRSFEPSSERLHRERAQLQAIEKALRDRDQLEDEYAPYGVLVEPVMKDGVAVDLICSFGNADAHGKARSDLVTVTASIPVPLPPGAKLEDYLISVELPDFMPPSEGTPGED